MNCANEPRSRRLPPKVSDGPYVWRDGHSGTHWTIGPYQVAMRLDWFGAEPKDGATYAMLQICRTDGGSVIDWRDMQQIKTQLLGAEWEAVEMFPAESRLKDPSNARYLWGCSRQLPLGLPGGRVVTDSCGVPQRPGSEVLNCTQDES